MVQEIVTRMARNSFSLKGWVVTIITGVFVLAAKEATVSYFLLSYIPIVLFWFLDAYYLSMERRYRHLYNKVRIQDVDELTFDLTPPKADEATKTLFWQSFLSRTELGLYLPLALLVIAVILIKTA